MKPTRIFLLTLLVIWGCSEDHAVKGPEAGYFRLSYMVTPDKGGRKAISMANPQTEFNLGDIKASREFYFLLGNASTNPITDITLEANDQSVVISPTTISSLSAQPNDFLPLISVSVIHGVQINGVGFTDILEKGQHEILLTIKGKTTADGSTVNLESTFKLFVTAKVMDIELMDGGTVVDLTTPSSGTTGIIWAGGLGTIPGYIINSGTIAIKNTGNVPIAITVTSLLGLAPSSAQVTPDQIVNLTLPVSTDPAYPFKTCVITLDGNGTITSYARIKLGNDGKGYIMIE